MSHFLRFVFCGLVMVAPWLYGAATPRPQFFLFLGFAAVAILRWLQRFFRRQQHPAPPTIPVILAVPLLFVVIGFLQLTPLAPSPIPRMESATLVESRLNLSVEEAAACPELSAALQRGGTVSVEQTRLVLAQIGLLVLVFWIGFDLFEDVRSRRWAFGALAINGAAIAIFGLAQQLSWNGKLFWTIPLRFGGSPFGPFVNRNNCAGYLLVALGGAVASTTSAWFPFGISRGTAQTGSYQLRITALLLQILGRLTPHVLIPATCMVCILMGIFASMSRAGVISASVMALVLIPSIGRMKPRLLLAFIGVACMACGGLYLAGRSDFVSQRMGTLLDLPEALEGRLTLWKEASRAAGDMAPLGSGWGTFPYVQTVYEDQDDTQWNMHAENQYIETLVEAGPIALAALICGLFLALLAAARAIRNDTEGQLMDAGLWGIAATTGLACMSLSDFSLVIGGVAITYFSFLGIAFSALSRDAKVSRWVLWSPSDATTRYSISALILFISGIALYELQTPFEIERITDRLPVLVDDLPNISVEETDATITELERASRLYPQSSEIWEQLAKAHIYRCRRMMFDELKTVETRGRWTDPSLWQLTHMMWVDRAAAESRQSGAAEIDAFLSRPAIQKNLPPARSALRRAMGINPLRRGLAIDWAWVERILGDEVASRVALKLAIFTSPGQAATLVNAGQLARRLNDEPTAIAAWRRSLTASDQWSTQVWNLANIGHSEEEVEQVLIPDRLEILVPIAKSLNDLTVRKRLLARCEALIASDPSIPAIWVARYRLEMGDLAGGIESFQEAIRKAPRDVELRLEAATAMEQAGQITAARVQLGVCQGLAPHNKEIQARFNKLILREAELATPSAP